jgi:hypothetical protein
MSGATRSRLLWLHCALSVACRGAAAPAITAPHVVDAGFSNPVGIVAPYDAAASVDVGGADSGAGCDSTFSMIAHGIFEAQGCTGHVCHALLGPDTPAAALDLSRAHAYKALVHAPSVAQLEQPMDRVQPGDPQHSLLYLKLAAKASLETLPAGGGSGMPLGLPALNARQLELVKRWIEAGAPETGLVVGAPLLAGCDSP